LECLKEVRKWPAVTATPTGQMPPKFLRIDWRRSHAESPPATQRILTAWVSSPAQIANCSVSSLHHLLKRAFRAGDPDDRRLRKVEIEIMIPKKMRERARKEKCAPEEKEFSDCCLKAGLAMVVKCRSENTRMKACLERWYKDEEFKKQCTEEYLQERAEYRRTGLSQKAQRYLA
jgi:COX assembly mitochondrial protein 1